jgi:hypothetical protein
MGIAIRAGVVLGVLVTIWQFVMGITGWYKDPVLLNVFFAVIVFEVVALLWALKRTAPTSTYGGQMLNGLVFALVASAIIFCGSLAFTTVAFPHYFEEMKAMQAEAMRARGLAPAEIDTALAAFASTQTPLVNALSGVIGTVVTAVAVSAVAAAFWRKKPVEAA